MAKRSKKTSTNNNDPYADRESRKYDNPIASREHILSLIEQQGAMTRAQILKQLNIKGQDQREALRRRLRAMERDNQLLFHRKDESYSLIQQQDLVQGRIEAHRDGYGFVLLEGQDDIYLSEREMRQVFHNDEVLVMPIGRSRRGGIEGSIVEVVKRNNPSIVGRLHRESGVHFVVPDNPRLAHDILLPDEGELSASIGDYVSIEVTKYPTARSSAEGKIIEVLGAALAPGLEIDIAIRSHGIPYQWSDEVIAETNSLGAEPDDADKQHRVDLRHLPLVTIDGEDARDFDDAVYCQKRKGGGFTLWVAIADVGHYVPIDSALDVQARERGTSVYFPGRVVPMLPEALSNGLCSLKPEVDRLCIACEMTVSARGKLTGYQFYEAVMHSHARLTYSDVAEGLGLLEKSPRTGLIKRIHHLMPHLQDLYALYQCLQKARYQRGAIDFETTETRIVFNAEKKIEAIEPVFRNEAHKIIEECMLCANVAAARLLEAHDREILYRVHLGPSGHKLDNLRAYLGELGLSLAGGEDPGPKDYQVLMQTIEQRPDAHLIQIMMLRSLSQAVYQPDNQGHFGLAFQAYTHFTSPIRRYPDLLVHRAIRSIVRSRIPSEQVRRVKGAKVIARKNSFPYDAEDMLAAGMHCSMTERRADDATRDVVAWLKCEYLHDRIGETFVGVVAGVTHFGLFIELENLFVEGLLRISSLDNDYFRFDQAHQRLVGERTRKVYRLGDRLRVVVARVDLDERRIELESDGKASSVRSKKGKESKRSDRAQPKGRKKGGASKTKSRPKAKAQTGNEPGNKKRRKKRDNKKKRGK